MKNQSAPLVNFNKYSDTQLERVCYNIIANMTDNNNFPTNIASLNSVKYALTKFSTIRTGAHTDEPYKIALTRQYRYELEEMLHILAADVNKVCQGDVSKLLSSGFSFTKTVVEEQVRFNSPENYKMMLGATSCITSTPLFLPSRFLSQVILLIIFIYGATIAFNLLKTI